MKKSRASRDGGAYGMAGGFSSGNAVSSGSRVKTEGSRDIEILDNKNVVDSASIMKTQPLGGRIKPPEEGDPVYMLATFKDSMCMLFSPVLRLILLIVGPRKSASLTRVGSRAITSPASPSRCNGRDTQRARHKDQERRR